MEVDTGGCMGGGDMGGALAGHTLSPEPDPQTASMLECSSVVVWSKGVTWARVGVGCWDGCGQ